ncbi:MAG: RsmB/NOP family class I SAM-dependent RNA methyltransferase [Clostridia bacterium]|nr:RsmB/NOP family class I SAM-dependent RNA methyltransferase [Clostridia bacterium]
MKRMLGEEYSEYEACIRQPHFRGIRINTLKFRIEDSEKLGLPITICPFSESGFYLNSDDQSIGNSPWHHAGAIYSQEPSAMSAVTILDPKPGEKILDMCAAPGGKSTQIAAKLDGKGLLWSNEYVRKRAQILISNAERMGIRNCVVSNAHPDRLAENLGGFFDRVLVDAPCSGEGMFRRDRRAVEEWSPEHSAACAARQLAILDSAAKCLRGGGILVYSTCTFSACENEDVISEFLDSHPDFILEPSGVEFGRSGFDRSEKYDLTLTRRIFPMDGGEGHFAAKMRRIGDEFADLPRLAGKRSCDEEKKAAALFDECFNIEPYGNIKLVGNSCYIIPDMVPDVKGVGILRCGVLLGDVMKNRIEPAHALFMASGANECRAIVRLEPDSRELTAFLHGEEIHAESGLNGYTAIACGDVVTGFGKCTGDRIKNRYPKGLRML